ncbi:hypothetical protein HOB91_02260 [Candidatus Woesearchaeota archaeon]|nr:hypothetical protein [Candidatus Woesearchaeota archaeon]MBT6402192.1 hypothetical protein [Candidatus Woesearchaeota archaeon]
MKFQYFFLFVFLMMGLLINSNPVSAPALIPTYIVAVPVDADYVVTHNDQPNKNSFTGIESGETQRALVKYTVDEIQYLLGEVDVTLTSNVILKSDKLTRLLDISDKKVIFKIDDSVSVVSGDLTMYILKDSGDSIVVCGGALTAANVGVGCGTESGITEEVIRLNGGYTGRYTVESRSWNGNDYWKIEGITGTGIHTFSQDFGGGDDSNILTKDEIVNLDQGEGQRSITSREDIEFFILFEGKKYKMMMRSIDPNNEFGSLFVESKQNTLPFVVDDLIDLDLNQDGNFDVTLEIKDISYPDVYLDIRLFEEDFKLEAKIKNSKDSKQGSTFSSGGIWSRFVKDANASETQLILLFGFSIVVLILFVLVGGKLISKIWRAT